MLKRTINLCLTAGLVAGAIGMSGCAAAPTTPDQAAQPSAQSQPAAPAQTSPAPSPGKTAPVTKLVVVDKTVGQGPAAKAGDLVTVDYTGWLTDGKMFDSSANAGKPFQFTLGQGKVIPGWEQGVTGMKVGGVRTLTIPPDLGYGAAGAGGVIPPNATLVFEVKLLKIN